VIPSFDFSKILDFYGDFMMAKENTSLLVLVALGFVGGLISSLLPCVLSLLPVNLAYIGTLNIENKIQAFKKASAFVLGVVVVMTCLGVFGGLAFAVFTEFKGPINIVVGFFIILMSLAILEIIKLPLPKFFSSMPNASPFVVGTVFALVSSPCSSPILISVLSIASSMNSVFKSMILMFGYSLGYSAIIFMASFSTGLIKQLSWFKQNSNLLIRFSGVALMLLGAFYAYVGFKNL
jgi:cytochrome c-type biogenesis protein